MPPVLVDLAPEQCRVDDPELAPATLLVARQRLVGAWQATNTSSRPGRSGASRTSSTTKPASTRSAVTASRLRKRRVDSEVIVASVNTRVERKVTSSPRTSVTSTHDSTRPSPGVSATVADASRVHSRQASRAGSRVSNTRWPPARTTSCAVASIAPHASSETNTCATLPVIVTQSNPRSATASISPCTHRTRSAPRLAPGHVDRRGAGSTPVDVEPPCGQQHRERAGAAAEVEDGPRAELRRDGGVRVEVAAVGVERVVDRREPAVGEETVRHRGIQAPPIRPPLGAETPVAYATDEYAFRCGGPDE